MTADEITGVTDIQSQTAPSLAKASYWPPFITVALLIIATIVGVAIWATNAHADIKDWTAEQDYVTNQELREVMKEQYVPLHRFTAVEQALANQKDDLKDLKTKMDKVLQRLPSRHDRDQ